MNFEKESSLALSISVRAADFLAETPDATSIISKETSRDLVSQVDLRIERFIVEQLSSSPYPILGEEGGWCNHQGSDEPEKYWAIDPIDGTVNFIHGIPFYGTSLGLIGQAEKDYEFLVGAITFPQLKEVYVTHGDEAALLNGKVLKGGNADLKQSLVIAAFPSAKTEKEFAQLQYHLFGELNHQTRGCLRIGSAALGVCYVAANKAQLAYSFSAKIWDVAGALAVARLSGVEVWTKKIPQTQSLMYAVGSKSAVSQFKEQAALMGINYVVE